MGSRAVVSGASVAGLSVAFWLGRIGWRVTVVERAPSFREGGQNIDVRGTAHDVLDRMGLTEAVRAQNTTETGTVFVDEHGEVTNELPSAGRDGATAELEILRGDLARVIFDALPDGIEFVYGGSVDAVVETDEAITVTLTSGQELTADLLIVAEGVRSTTRDRLFGDEVGRRELGVTMAFGTIPRTGSDDDRWRWYTATGGRQVHLRPDNHGTTRAILACTGDGLTDLDATEARSRLRARFSDAGWEAARVLDGFDSSDDVYIDDLVQIRMERYHRGRICLVGDAAWCVTPMGGGGCSLALTAAYVLAAFLSTGDDRPVEDALGRYEAWMKPMIDNAQVLPRAVVRAAYPQSRAGIRLRNAVVSLMTSSPLSKLGGHTDGIAESSQDLPELRSASALPPRAESPAG